MNASKGLMGAQTIRGKVDSSERMFFGGVAFVAHTWNEMATVEHITALVGIFLAVVVGIICAHGGTRMRR